MRNACACQRRNGLKDILLIIQKAGNYSTYTVVAVAASAIISFFAGQNL